MIKGNEPINPVFGSTGICTNIEVLEYYNNKEATATGLTKREHFAALNTAAILGRFYELPPETQFKQLNDWIKKYGHGVKIREAIAADAVEMSDALIHELNNSRIK